MRRFANGAIVKSIPFSLLGFVPLNPTDTVQTCRGISGDVQPAAGGETP